MRYYIIFGTLFLAMGALAWRQSAVPMQGVQISIDNERPNSMRVGSLGRGFGNGSVK